VSAIQQINESANQQNGLRTAWHVAPGADRGKGDKRSWELRTTDSRERASPGISVEIEAMAAYLAGQPDVVAAYLFGSVARGQADRLSDVDIAVLFDAGLEAEESVERQLRLMGDLEAYTHREVQVVVLNRAPPLLAYQAVWHGILLYERSRLERIDFEVRARRVYFDFKPWLDFHTQALLKDIQEVGLSERRKRPGGALEAARGLYQRLKRTPEH
jgi:predicted nucleotidyltransferase